MAIFKNTEKQEKLVLGNTYKDFFVYGIQIAGIFITTFLILFAFGLTPENIRKNFEPEVKPSDLQTQQVVTRNSPVTKTTPTRVIIDKAGIDSIIERPQATDIATLDQALNKGAVYYPGSGTIENGNIFLFGHSSNWAVVRNQAYKTFNGLEKLDRGDSITLWGDDGEVYTYVVQRVTLVDEDEALVNFDKEGSTLTISTCNTFGEKQERWVVEAVLRS